MDKKKEYMEKYRNKIRRVVADIKPEVKDKLLYIVKEKNISIAKWITQKIEEEYNRLNK